MLYSLLVNSEDTIDSCISGCSCLILFKHRVNRLRIVACLFVYSIFKLNCVINVTAFMWLWLKFVGWSKPFGERQLVLFCWQIYFNKMSTSSSSAPRASPKSFYFVQKAKSQVCFTLLLFDSLKFFCVYLNLQEGERPASRGSPKIELHSAPLPRAQREEQNPISSLGSWVTGLFRRSDHAYQPIDGQKIRKVNYSNSCCHCDNSALVRSQLKLNRKYFLPMKELFLLGYICPLL